MGVRVFRGVNQRPVRGLQAVVDDPLAAGRLASAYGGAVEVEKLAVADDTKWRADNPDARQPGHEESTVADMKTSIPRKNKLLIHGRLGRTLTLKVQTFQDQGGRGR